MPFTAANVHRKCYKWALIISLDKFIEPLTIWNLQWRRSIAANTYQVLYVDFPFSIAIWFWLAPFSDDDGFLTKLIKYYVSHGHIKIFMHINATDGDLAFQYNSYLNILDLC